MINFNDVTGENIKEHNPTKAQISNHPYTILITGAMDQEKQTHY